tara:strand:+ start:82 stop:1005 length:924 start_codon:yes stop_codon:yes gene_type:complete
MSGSTFAGKSTVDTIRNYAEMLIDDLNSNLPESAGEHWNKAREIDNKTAKKVFGEEYSDRIGEAYYNCVMKYQIEELNELYGELHIFLEVLDFGKMVNQSEKIEVKSNFIMMILDVALSICPQSADLNSAYAWVCVTNMATGKVPIGDIDKPRDEWEEKGDVEEKVEDCRRLKKKGKSFIDRALEIQPEHSGALEARQTFALLEKVWDDEFGEDYKDGKYVGSGESKSSCFIATAAYGTPFAKEIDVLRNWRDEVLETSYSGRLFIKTYYTLSPPVAGNISGSSVKRKAVRTVLGPIVKILKNNYSN